MIGDANRVSASDAKRATVHCCRGHRSAVTSSPGFAYRSEFSNDHRYIARDDGILGRATLHPALPLSSQSSPDCCADRNPGQAPELQSAGARGMTMNRSCRYTCRGIPAVMPASSPPSKTSTPPAHPLHRIRMRLPAPRPLQASSLFASTSLFSLAVEGPSTPDIGLGHTQDCRHLRAQFLGTSFE
jgi:hypothetical protein